MQRPLLVNGALVALALGTFGVVWATREAPTTSELRARKNQLFPELTIAKVDAVTLSKAGQSIELRRQDGQFQILKPWPERADVATLNKWLSAADMAMAERPAEGVSDERAGFGPNAYRVTLDVAGKISKLTLGDEAPAPSGARYAKVESDGHALTCVVRASVASELEVPFDGFRETRLLEYGKRELAKLTLDSPAGAIDLEQREHGAFFVRVGTGWELAQPAMLRRITEQLAHFSSELFVEPEQARSALRDAPIHLKLTPKDAAAGAVTITLGGACPKNPQQALLLREQTGRAPRAGCVDASFVTGLSIENDALRLRGPFAAETDEVEELYIARGAAKLELARKDKGFVLRAPGHSEVPLDVGNERIAAILGAEGELATTDVVGSGDAEIRVQIAGGDEASHREERILLGKRRPDHGLCFKRLADGITRCVTDEHSGDLEPDARLLRSLTLLDFAPSELVSFSVKTHDLEQRVGRGADGNYELEAPKGFAYDAARVTDAVQGLGTLQATRWVAPGDEPNQYGLNEPVLRARVRLTSSTEERELLIGNTLRGGYYGRLSPDPAVFVLGASLVSTLSEPLIDRALAPFTEDELATVEYRIGAGPPQKAEAALREALLALRASGVAHVGAARPDEGFERPELTLEYAAKSGKRKRVMIGLCEPLHASRCYARREGVNATFLLHNDIARTFRDLIQR